MSARAALACLALGIAPLTGCGRGSSEHAQHMATASITAGEAKAAPAIPVRLQLELPLIGLSGAPTVSYATSERKPALHGVVRPANATVYVLAPDGTRTAVVARRDGRFTVRPKLTPGSNVFRFTAARLGAQSAGATLALTWRGPGAAARQRAIAADPAKYLPPASAGLNRKIPVSVAPPPVKTGGSISVAFSLNPIKAPPPPPIGGTGRWLGGFELTEYYPALESWFAGAPVATPGLPGTHRIDWLYSARGLSMEGDGIGLDGKQYHIENLGSGGWLTAGGAGTARFGNGGSAPFWRTGGFWRSASGALTFPLAQGGWSSGVGAKYVNPPAGISFAPGPSRPLAYLRSVAVDPRLIPFGSHIFIPAYRSVNGGWFEADDTGGAIIGRHIDVFRPPPSNPGDQGNFATGQQVYIVAPGRPLP